MKSEEKILKVLQQIKNKVDLSPKNTAVNYRAGEEVSRLSPDEEIMILNKLEEEGIIEVVSNFSNDYS